MKLLSVSFLLILAAFGMLKNRRKRKNENSKENKQSRNEQNGAADGPHPPTSTPQKHPLVDIPVAQPISEDEQKWRDEQKRFWNRQLSLARKLNWITFFAGAVGIGGLIILYFTLKATQEASTASKDQAGAAKIATEIAKQTFDENVKTFPIGSKGLGCSS